MSVGLVIVAAALFDQFRQGNFRYLRPFGLSFRRRRSAQGTCPDHREARRLSICRPTERPKDRKLSPG